MLPPPPRSTLFPYTTLFRSNERRFRRPVTGSSLVALVARRTTRSSLSRRCTTSSPDAIPRSEEHTSELQSLRHLVCRLLLEKKKKNNTKSHKHATSIRETTR